MQCNTLFILKKTLSSRKIAVDVLQFGFAQRVVTSHDRGLLPEIRSLFGTSQEVSALQNISYGRKLINPKKNFKIATAVSWYSTRQCF